MPIITPEIYVELYCGGCGAGICANGLADRECRYARLTISPCETCLQAARAVVTKESDASVEDLKGRLALAESKVTLLDRQLELALHQLEYRWGDIV